MALRGVGAEKGGSDRKGRRDGKLGNGVALAVAAQGLVDVGRGVSDAGLRYSVFG